MLNRLIGARRSSRVDLEDVGARLTLAPMAFPAAVHPRRYPG